MSCFILFWCYFTIKRLCFNVFTFRWFKVFDTAILRIFLKNPKIHFWSMGGGGFLCYFSGAILIPLGLHCQSGQVLLDLDQKLIHHFFSLKTWGKKFCPWVTECARRTTPYGLYCSTRSCIESPYVRHLLQISFTGNTVFSFHSLEW